MEASSSETEAGVQEVEVEASSSEMEAGVQEVEEEASEGTVDEQTIHTPGSTKGTGRGSTHISSYNFS